MTTLIAFLSADISVGFAFSIMMVAILIMAAISQVMQSDYEDTISDMAKDMHETNERYQDLVYRLFDTIDDAQVIIDMQEAELDQLRNGLPDLFHTPTSNAIYQSLYESVKPMSEEDKAELRKMEL